MNQPTPVLLLPGLMNDERVWSPLLPVLGAGRRVHIAPTHLHASVVDSAREAIAALPPGSFAVAGFSLGGYVALEVCRQASERIAGLGLLDTGAGADSEEARQARVRMVQAMGRGTATLGQIAAGFASRVVHPSRLQDKALLSLLADMAASVGSAGFARQQQASMDRVDSRAMLKDLRVPALVLCGREDQVTPLALSEEMAALLPDAELVTVEVSGHMTTLEQPGIVVPAVLRWLDRVDARSV
ncbi:alpha/beta fold hydrolase [Caenimonas terrae]|uniref:Alpha/beta fold hydrolase n=1 Tax=Caenimonas terrae TaxID=696074 RepID=A0ABW0NJF4_9BURK